MITNRHVLTNAHVVLGDDGRPLDKTLVFYSFENPNDGIEQNFRKGRQAKVSHYSEKLDLALLEVEDPPKVSPLSLGPADGVQIGDPVLAIGHPENGGLWSLTSGRIGARIRNAEGVRGNHIFQTEASLNRGNSGGPLLNEDGQMIGVNTSIARKASDGLAITGINFAVQSDVAREWLQSVGLRLPKAMAVAANRPTPTPTPEKPVATAPETKPAATTAEATKPAATTAATKPAKPTPPAKETPAPVVVSTPPKPSRNHSYSPSLVPSEMINCLITFPTRPTQSSASNWKPSLKPSRSSRVSDSCLIALVSSNTFKYNGTKIRWA